MQTIRCIFASQKIEVTVSKQKNMFFFFQNHVRSGKLIYYWNEKVIADRKSVSYDTHCYDHKIQSQN